MIKSIVDCGINVIITGSKFSEMAMHYCERHGVLMLKVISTLSPKRATHYC
jgi:formate dehydrogenase assembly factor FdhD